MGINGSSNGSSGGGGSRGSDTPGMPARTVPHGRIANDEEIASGADAKADCASGGGKGRPEEKVVATCHMELNSIQHLW